MYEKNEYYYDSDEDSYEDFDDDELDDAEKNYLSEENIDNLIHTIRMYGSKYHYPEIEELILKTNEESVFQWFQVFQLIRDPTGSKIQTFNEIEALLDAQNLRLKKTNSTLTLPINKRLKVQCCCMKRPKMIFKLTIKKTQRQNIYLFCHRPTYPTMTYHHTSTQQ
jgi:hypothetical protein